VSSLLLVRWVIGAALALFMFPRILFCLWPRALRSWFVAGPEGIDGAAPPTARELIARLKDLGFEALGVKAEKPPFRAAVRELAFVAADRRCYASLGVGRPQVTLYYYTPLATGGLVLTSNGSFPTIASPAVVQRSYPKCEARELLEHHLEGLASLGQRGEVAPTSAARLQATSAYYDTPQVRGVLRRVGVISLVGLLVLEWLVLHR
jgi:hypothetical protein